MGGAKLTRPVVGVYGAFNLSERFAIQPEIFYLTHGGGGQFPDSIDPSLTRKIMFEYRYLQVPVLAKFRLMQGVRATPVVFAGPSVGFLLSAEGRYYLENVLESEQDVTDTLKRLNFGLIFGAGVDWRLSRLSLIFDARFDMGLTNISKVNPGSPITKTRTFSFLVGVGF